MATDTVFIYTMNRGVQGGAWGRYVFPFTIEHFTHLENTLYMRHGDDIVYVIEGAIDDDGVGYEAEIQWPWLDFGAPGVSKVLDGFDIVGTGHIFIGIVSVEDCLAATILKNLGAEIDKCVELYEKLCKPSGQNDNGKTKLSEDIHNVVKCAYEQSNEWGHEYIGAEHLLIGVLLAGTGQGFKILTALGITLEKVREETNKLIVCHNTQTERNEK